MRFAWAVLLLIASVFNPAKAQNQRKSQLIIELVGSNSTQLEITNLAARALNFTNTTSLEFSVTDINECESNTLNTCSENANCTNTDGSFTCQCHEGYEDSNPTNNPGRTCIDINECENVTICHGNALCNNTPGDYDCNCKPGYQYLSGTKSSLICEDIDECKTGTHNCSPNATCTNGEGDFTCSCISGYTGDGYSCTEIKKDPDTTTEQTTLTKAITTETTDGATTAFTTLPDVETTVSSSPTTLDTTHEILTTTSAIETTARSTERDATTEVRTTTSIAEETSVRMDTSSSGVTTAAASYTTEVATVGLDTPTPTNITTPEDDAAYLISATEHTTEGTEERTLSSTFEAITTKTQAITTPTITTSDWTATLTAIPTSGKLDKTSSVPTSSMPESTATESTTDEITEVTTTQTPDAATTSIPVAKSSPTVSKTQPVETSSTAQTTVRTTTTETVLTTETVASTAFGSTTNNAKDTTIGPVQTPSTTATTEKSDTSITTTLPSTSNTSAGAAPAPTTHDTTPDSVIAYSIESESTTTREETTFLKSTDSATTAKVTATNTEPMTATTAARKPLVTTTTEVNATSDFLNSTNITASAQFPPSTHASSRVNTSALDFPNGTTDNPYDNSSSHNTDNPSSNITQSTHIISTGDPTQSPQPPMHVTNSTGDLAIDIGDSSTDQSNPARATTHEYAAHELSSGLETSPSATIQTSKATITSSTGTSPTTGHETSPYHETTGQTSTAMYASSDMSTRKLNSSNLARLNARYGTPDSMGVASARSATTDAGGETAAHFILTHSSNFTSTNSYRSPTTSSVGHDRTVRPEATWSGTEDKKVLVATASETRTISDDPHNSTESMTKETKKQASTATHASTRVIDTTQAGYDTHTGTPVDSHTIVTDVTAVRSTESQLELVKVTAFASDSTTKATATESYRYLERSQASGPNSTPVSVTAPGTGSPNHSYSHTVMDGWNSRTTSLDDPKLTPTTQSPITGSSEAFGSADNSTPTEKQAFGDVTTQGRNSGATTPHVANATEMDQAVPRTSPETGLSPFVSHGAITGESTSTHLDSTSKPSSTGLSSKVTPSPATFGMSKSHTYYTTTVHDGVGGEITLFTTRTSFSGATPSKADETTPNMISGTTSGKPTEEITETTQDNLELTTVYVSVVPDLYNVSEASLNVFTGILLNESVSMNAMDARKLTENLNKVLDADFNVSTETAGKLLSVVDKFQNDFVGEEEPPDGEEPKEPPKIEPEQAAQLTQFVSTLLETMVLPVGETFNKTTKTLAIQAVNLPEEQAFKNGSDFKIQEEKVIELPGPFLESSTLIEGEDDSGSLQIASSRYSDARLFPAEGVDYVNPNRTRKIPPYKGGVIVSAVAGTSIAGRNVVNATGHVLIRLPRAVLADNQEHFDNGTYDRISYVDAKCVFFNYSLNNGTGGWSDKGCTIHNPDDVHNTSCSCNHLTNFAVLMSAKVTTVDPILNYLSYAGCGLSIFGLLWTIMTYSVFKTLRKHNSKKVLLHFCVALCSVYVTYLTAIALKLPSTGTQCLVAGVFMHYFTLCVMAWMFVEVLDMYFMFVKLRHTALHKYMLKVSLIGWMFPLLIAVATLGAHFGLEGKDWYVAERRLYPKYISKDDTICWLEYTGMMYAFIFPSCLILIVNLILFIIVLYNITCKRNNGRLTRIRSTKKKITARQHLINAIALLLLAGPTWIFGYFINIEPIADGAIKRTFSYIFVLFNAFQGLWVFIVFSVRPEPVRRLWYELLVKRRLIDSSQTNSRSWQHGTQRNTVSTVATKSPRPSIVPPSTAGSSTKSHLDVNRLEKRVVANRISNTSSNSEQSKSSTRSSAALLVAKPPDSGTSFKDNKTAPRRRRTELGVPSATPPPENIKEDDEESSCASSASFGNKERDMTGSPASSRSCADSERDLVET